MCFKIHDKYPNLKIAKRDIPCYKILTENSAGKLKSPFRFFEYQLKKIYKTEIGEKSATFSIHSGFHSLSNKIIPWSLNCTNKYKAIIPKGSLYYYNPDDKEYVSNQIIIVEKLY